MDKKFKVFVDFDGTITKLDVGDSIFRQFGNKEEVDKIIEDLLDDKISAKQCWLSLCESTGKIDKNKFDEFISTMEIDESFPSIVNFCKQNEIELFVLSDGFDYYIKKIFEKENLQDIKIYSNKLTIGEDGKLIPSFPFLDSQCTTSANCKRNHIINHSSDEDFTVFIGDGNSDKYTVQFCDFIFAKDDLLKFCEAERITYFPFKNFYEVITKLEQLRQKKRLKKRHQAELKRKELYMME
ncbi:MAG: MtnX-like HAD-IB family phosphatase [Bacteroidetes bacterium]|nr:MtnX-like HAD-IB family phosphatase [Bacteroidota bacterium]